MKRLTLFDWAIALPIANHASAKLNLGGLGVVLAFFVGICIALGIKHFIVAATDDEKHQKWAKVVIALSFILAVSSPTAHLTRVPKEFKEPKEAQVQNYKEHTSEGLSLEPVEQPDPLIGRWDYDSAYSSGSITIKSMSDSYFIEGDAVKHSMSAPQAGFSGAVPRDDLINNQTISITYDQCTVEITFLNDILYVEDNYRCGGLNATVTGEYKKTNDQ